MVITVSPQKWEKDAIFKGCPIHCQLSIQQPNTYVQIQQAQMQVQHKIPIDGVTMCPPTIAIMALPAISNIDVSQSAGTKQTDYLDGFIIIVIALIYWINMTADNFVDYEEEW